MKSDQATLVRSYLKHKEVEQDLDLAQCTLICRTETVEKILLQNPIWKRQNLLG